MTEPSSSAARASAPASSANLGPGFDTIALALGLRCSVTVQVGEEWTITHGGPEAFIGDTADDAVLRAAQRVSDRPLRIEVDNQIPLSSGLGSSAAAFAAGSLAALRANGADPDHDELFGHVRELEGHPDNAAAAVYGGLVAVASGEVISLSLSADLVPVVAVPEARLKTSVARLALPEAHAVDVVSRTLGRIAALIEGLRTGSAALLRLAGGDELHEAPRAGLNPVVAHLMESARQAGALHVCWSGAGPSVLALTGEELADDVVDALARHVGADGRVLVLAPDMLGAC